MGAQEQIATFFATSSHGRAGSSSTQTPERFFEMPISLPLPEGLNFIPPTAPAAAPAPVSGSLASGPIPTDAATATLNGEPLRAVPDRHLRAGRQSRCRAR